MCGIAGFFRFNDRESGAGDSAIALRQIATMRYRGPDAFGVHTGPGFAFAHARLSIIDVSTSANQPMSDASEDVTIVFNGEIYNFQSLRSELESRGAHFRTRSDTEVIVEGYKAWGVNVVDRLRGMFAIALFDRRRDRLILMRDRIGKKPLYYSVVGNSLVFASEIKGIVAFPGFKRETNFEAIHEYLTFQYVPSPGTAFAGVHRLPPAHVLIVQRDGRTTASRYFSLPTPRSARPQPIAALREELVAQLREATRLRMISDVPLGAFLSGGVDSSAVVAMMANCSSVPVRTFTIGFDEEAYDERAYARIVADRYGTRHSEMIVRPDAMSVLPALVYHYGEPFADSSAIPTYYVSKIAREHVTVILSGDGGDENFLGYPRYQYCRAYDRIASLPNPIFRSITYLTQLIPESVDRPRLLRRVRNVGARLLKPRSRRYEQFIVHFSDDSKHDLYAGDLRKYLAGSALDRLDAYFDEAPTMAMGAAWADTHTYLPDDLLIKVDVASMANSLEVRAPFLDQELMTWAAGVTEEQRYPNHELKGLLKQAMEPFLPKELLYRPKMGFGVPIDHWLRSELREFAYDTLLSKQAQRRGLFQAKSIERLLDLHNGGENWSTRIWSLLMLELWFEMWIDPADPFDGETARQIIRRYSTDGVAVASVP
jgi:asparagine synthase (glutamine-hydrolysing)